LANGRAPNLIPRATHSTGPEESAFFSIEKRKADCSFPEMTRLVSQDLKYGLNSLENAGGAHAAPDAHGDHAVASVTALQFTDEGSG